MSPATLFYKFPILFLAIAIIFLSCPVILAQGHTAGLLQYDSLSFKGYTLFEPIGHSTAYLIDNYGRVVHSWAGEYPPALSVYLMENGNLLKSIKSVAGAGGGFREIAPDGTVLWDYRYYSSEYVQHHDIEPLPNGNVLILAREYMSYSEAIESGRDPSLMQDDSLSPEHIVEIRKTGANSGEIVWEWHAWDHLIQDYDAAKGNYGTVGDHPELIDINHVLNNKADWIHANAIAYNPDLDQIIINSRNLCEFWVLDHSTTTAEASGHTGGNNGHGGDVLYRWGNPQTYRAGDADDQEFFVQHDAHWIEPGLPGAGNILVFNNGINRPEGNYSTIDELTTPVDPNGHYPVLISGFPHGPIEQQWVYTATPPTSFYSSNISGVQRMPNGNTLICSGRSGRFFEVTNDGDIVWEYKSPILNDQPVNQGDTINYGDNPVFRCYRYPADYPGLSGYELNPGMPIEIYPIMISGTSHQPESPTAGDMIRISTIFKTDRPIIEANIYLDTSGIINPIPMVNDSALGIEYYYSASLPLFPGGKEITYYISVTNDTGAVTYDPTIAPSTTYSFSVGHLCGDPDNDGTINILDITFIIAYLYQNGPAPESAWAADVNSDSNLNILDITRLITFLYNSGPGPSCL